MIMGSGKPESRPTGWDLIPDVPWGTHLCQFYESRQDLEEMLAPYFAEGLRNNEYCMWITSDPMTVSDAEDALRRELGDLEPYSDRLVILPHTDWYLRGGYFDFSRTLDGWARMLDIAIAQGCDGMRISGNTAWLEEGDWEGFVEYEAAVDEAVSRSRIIAL